MKCAQCGVCCKLFLVNLADEEYKSGRYKTVFDEFVEEFEEAEMVGANIVEQKEDGSCIYLEDNKCSIHYERPESCRNFFCDSKEKRFREMAVKIRNYKKGKQ